MFFLKLKMLNSALNIFFISLFSHIAIACIPSKLMPNYCVFLLIWNKIKVLHRTQWRVDVTEVL